MSKFSRLSFCQKLFFLNKTPECVHIVYEKYQIVPSKAVVEVDRPMFYKHKTLYKKPFRTTKENHYNRIGS